MKRDMDLIRKIMLELEASEKGYHKGEMAIEGYAFETIAFHCHLLMDAGLAEGMDITSLHSSGPEAELTHLTYAGYEFLDVARGRVPKMDGAAPSLAQQFSLLKRAGFRDIDCFWRETNTAIVVGFKRA